MILYEEILREFKKRKVKYVIVGGMAFNLLGSFRGTADLDILVEMTDNNLRKIVTILKKKKYRVRQPVDPIGIADWRIRKEWVHRRHMKALNFYKYEEGKEVDIIIESPVSYREARKTCVRIKSGSLTLPVISIDNLIKMKRTTGRDIDRYDIKVLKEIKRIKESKRKR